MLTVSTPSEGHTTSGQLPVFQDLNIAQASGYACIACPADYHRRDGAPVPDSVIVGISSTTGTEVRACSGSCANSVGWRPPAQWEQDTLL